MKDLLTFKDFLEWIPAITFPLSHVFQIHKIFMNETIEGVSFWTFYGWFLGNFGAYLFTDKLTDIKTILAFLVTGLLEIVICIILQHGNKLYQTLILLSTLAISAGVYYLAKYKKKYLDKISSIAGYFPAILFPLMPLLQAWTLLTSKSAKGVSIPQWILQIFGNIGAYILTGHSGNIKAISAYIVSAIIDVIVIIITIYKNKVFDKLI